MDLLRELFPNVNDVARDVIHSFCEMLRAQGADNDTLPAG
jgi:hypothetical protein